MDDLVSKLVRANTATALALEAAEAEIVRLKNAAQPGSSEPELTDQEADSIMALFGNAPSVVRKMILALAGHIRLSSWEKISSVSTVPLHGNGERVALSAGVDNFRGKNNVPPTPEEVRRGLRYILSLYNKKQ